MYALRNMDLLLAAAWILAQRCKSDPPRAGALNFSEIAGSCLAGLFVV